MERVCSEVESKLRRRPLLVLGDFNSPLTYIVNRKMDPPAAAQLKGLMCAIGCKSAHLLCPSRQKWTRELPCRSTNCLRGDRATSIHERKIRSDTEKKCQATQNKEMNSYSSEKGTERKGSRVRRQLDHILVGDRFSSSIRMHKVLKAPVPTTHCIVLADIDIKWRVGRPTGSEWVPWVKRRDEKNREKFKQKVWEETQKESIPTWENLSGVMVHTCKEILRNTKSPAFHDESSKKKKPIPRNAVK